MCQTWHFLFSPLCRSFHRDKAKLCHVTPLMHSVQVCIVSSAVWRTLLYNAETLRWNGYRCTFCGLSGWKPPSVILHEQLCTNSFVSWILQSHPYSRAANSSRFIVRLPASCVRDQTPALLERKACRDSCFLIKVLKDERKGRKKMLMPGTLDYL